MANPQNLRQPWQPGQSGNPKGRPKNRVQDTLVESLKLKKKKEITASLTLKEVKEWEEWLMSAASDDLSIIAQDNKVPIYARATARAILLDMKNGRTTTLDKLRDRVIGKDTQRVELTGKDGTDLIPARRLNEDEAKALMSSLETEY